MITLTISLPCFSYLGQDYRALLLIDYHYHEGDPYVGVAPEHEFLIKEYLNIMLWDSDNDRWQDIATDSPAKPDLDKKILEICQSYADNLLPKIRDEETTFELY